MSLKIETVLCRAGVMDNYSYLLTDKETGITAVIDPSESAPIVRRCKELGLTPQYVFNTHHHFDHTDANLQMKETFGARVVGAAADSRRIPGLDIEVRDGDSFMLGQSRAEIIRADGHTIGHILWYFPDDKALFTGDTLFNLCIGGLFEGTMEQMFSSLEKIKNLPDDTLFYPGHEYTMGGADFALYLNSDSPDLQHYLKKAQDRLRKGLPAGPVTLGEEKKCNPYLLAEHPEQLRKILG